jgi:hypothetical protein
MLRNVGCIQEGVRRQVFYTNGQYLDSILFGLTKEEYVEFLKGILLGSLSLRTGSLVE